MRPLTILGGYYVDATVAGRFVSLLPGRRFDTDAGDLPLPSPTSWPLTHRISEDGRQIAGQASASAGTWHYTGLDWILDPRICNGESAAIFDGSGALHVIGPGPGVSSQGYRYLAPDGGLVTGDETYGPRNGVTEYTDLSLEQDGSLLVGQGHEGGGVRAWAAGALRVLAEGACYAIRARRAGGDVVICWYEVAPDGLQSQIVWLTVAELEALPVAAVPVPAPAPVPAPPAPPGPPHPPAPKPAPQPAPPAPAPVPIPSPGLPPAHEVRTMKVYAKLGGRYVGCSPTPIPKRSGDAAFMPYHDREHGGSWEEIELTPHDGGRFDAVFVAAGRQLAIAPGGLLESRPLGSVGSWELVYATAQPDGSSLIYRMGDDGALVPTVLQLEAVS